MSTWPLTTLLGCALFSDRRDVCWVLTLSSGDTVSLLPSPLPVGAPQDLIQQHHYEGKDGVLTPSTTLPCGPDSLKPHGPRYM